MIVALAPCHLGKILEISNQVMLNPWSQTALEERLCSDQSFGYGYTHGELVGFSFGSLVIDEAEIHGFAVQKDHQRQGIGTHLLKHTLKALKAQGMSQLFLEVDVDNRPALHLYQSCGFSQQNHLKNYYTLPNGAQKDALALSIKM